MFKDKIRFYRKLRGISQEALADKLGYKLFTTIQNWRTSYKVFRQCYRT